MKLRWDFGKQIMRMGD